MADRRMIASDIWRDDFFMDLSFIGRLLWMGLVTHCADDQGRLKNHPRLISSDIFPLDNIPAEEIESLLQEFARAGLVVLYQADGKNLLQIVNWWQYQTPAWAVPSKYPPPPGWTDREKYHAAGNQVVNRNWEHPGGFQAQEAKPANMLQERLMPGGVPGRAIPGSAPQDDGLPESTAVCAAGSGLPPAPENSLPAPDPAVPSNGTGSALPVSLHSALCSGLPNRLHSTLGSGVGRAIEEVKVKEEEEGEGEAARPPASFFEFLFLSSVAKITDLPEEETVDLYAAGGLAAAAAVPQKKRGKGGRHGRKGKAVPPAMGLVNPARTAKPRHSRVNTGPRANRDPPGWQPAASSIIGNSFG